MKNKKTFMRWLCLLLLVAAVVGVTVAAAAEPVNKQVTVSQFGSSASSTSLALEKMPIVLPANATDVERSAAKELQHYLQEITGKAPVFLTEGVPVTSAIYIGATDYAAANNVTLEAGAYTDNNGLGEGWVIKAIGNNLVLTGGATRGPLYAVYHLLEDEFGVRWWNFWEEYVPTLETCTLPKDFESSGEPVFKYRDIYIGSEDTYNLHLTRNRVNGFMSNGPVGYGGEEYYFRPYHVHTFNRYFVPHYKEPTSASSAKWLDAINPDKVDWYVEHPEWYGYSKVEGKHVSHSQMCLSNEEFIETFIEKAMIAIEMSYEDAAKAGIAPPKYLDITPNDLPGGFCQCPKCEEAMAVSGPSGLLLQFINKIAAAVGEVYPEVTVETLAYWQYYEAPLDDTVPADNVVIRLCHSDLSVIHDLDHPINVESKRRLEDWAKILKPGQLYIWDYAINSGNTGSFPDWFRYQHDFAMLRDLGGAGVFIECEHATTEDFWDLKQWMILKLMEDPYQDTRELARTFVTGYYGEAAADYLMDYLNLAWDTKEDYNVSTQFNNAVGEVLWMSAEETMECHRLFDEATAATAADTSLSDAERELFLNRINMSRHCIDKQVLDNYNRYVNEMAAFNDPNRIFDLDKTEIGRRYVQSLKWMSEMKLEDDYTGLQNVPGRSSYGSVDSRLYSYNEYVTGKDNLNQDLPHLEIPQQVLDEHPGVSTRHIYDFPFSQIISAASYMPGMHDLPGEASYEGGGSVMFDLEELYAAYDDSRAFNSYAVTETKPFQSTLGKKLYLNDPVVADGKWHLYCIEDVVVSHPTFKQFRFFEDTIYIDLAEYPQFLNTPVDLYVSMKIEGDPTGQNSQNYGKIYVDRFIIVENCRVNYSEDIPATCEVNAKQAGYCIVCGKQNEKELPYTKLPHEITSGYTYHPETNTYTADCAVCGTAEFQFNGELPENVMADIVANGGSLDFVYELVAKDFRNTHPIAVVKDPDSAVGSAAFYDVSTKTGSSLDLMKITDEKPMSVAYNRLQNSLLAKDIILDGQYHAYKFPGEKIVTATDDTLIFFTWELRGDFGKFPIMDQKVDFYFSMKVEGDLTFDDPSICPKYYIDRMIVVASCADHRTSTYTYNAETGAYEGKCDTCKGIVRKNFAGDLPQEVQDRVEELGSNVAHIYEFSKDQLHYGSYSDAIYIGDDAEAAGGKALVYETSRLTRTAREADFIFSATKPFKLTAHSSGDVLGEIPATVLKANSGKGYVLYHWNGTLIPSNHQYTWGFDKSFRMDFEEAKSVLQGKNVDFYLSMKVVNDPTYTGVLPTKTPRYYIDRVIVVDSCRNHLNPETAVITTPATCIDNAIGSGYCSICERAVSNVEVEGTKVPHKFSNFVLDGNTGLYTAVCENDCGTIKTKAALPQQITDELAAAGIDAKHAHEYGPEGFQFKRVFTLVEDAAAATGVAARARARDSSPDPGSYIIYTHESFAVSQSTGNKLADMTSPMLTPMRGSSYKLLKLEDLKLDANMEYLTLFNGDLMIPEMAELAGKTIDLYVSMRVDGYINADASPDKYPIWYVDRVIAVDDCDQYETDQAEGDFPCMNGGANAGKCPVCGKVQTAASSGHVFTRYEQQKMNKNQYVAQCDYGCGTTDTKYYEKPVNMLDGLPAELPQSVKNHVIIAYGVADGEISTSSRYIRWDDELNRPVMIRAYDEAESTGQRNALDMTQALQIPINLWRGGSNTEILGQITRAQLVANAGKGYQLYLLDDIIPIEYNEYRYLYMFNDWGAYIEQFDDDLRDYKDQIMDVYVYLKVEGDPTCQSGVNPTYYLDQLIVATSCTVDETWDIITEPTCTQTGYAIGTCSVCGMEGSEVNLPKLPHNVIDSYVKVAPTCEDNMIVRGHCTMCNWDYCDMEVEGSALEHSFKTYKKLNDGSGMEEAWCEYGCGERHTRLIQPSLSNPKPNVPGSIQQLLPDLSGSTGTNLPGGFDFSDVKGSDWYFSSVKDAWSNGLVNGVTASQYRPNDTLTTAQAVKLAAAYHERSETGEVTLTNAAGNWYDTYVDYAVENGIVDSAYASKSVAEMNKPIERSEFVAIFAAAMDAADLEGQNDVADNAIPDVKMGDANAKAIYQFYRAGILTGSDAAGTFHPNATIKRSEVAAILSRMFNESVRQTVTLK